ncbi:imidazole glycerol phosphate synthase hisHF [Neoconidiobolus thromboides FSU 785]|nr:imidazole glycerol phosphate synthase hisHF [Neoconidiobolus thromboides FSU 785]
MSEENIYLLDYGAGNVRSLINAVSSLGYTIKTITSKEDFFKADKILFPGVGNFGLAMKSLRELGYYDSLKQYIQQNKKFLGICVGMQCLFEGSTEASEGEDFKGLDIISSKAQYFNNTIKAVPHMGWNQVYLHKKEKEGEAPLSLNLENYYYFVHSYAIPFDTCPKEWILSSTVYKGEHFVSAVGKGNVIGVQFHPEKSGKFGLKFLDAFLTNKKDLFVDEILLTPKIDLNVDLLSKRIVACLDVRTNEVGELIVTKGDQYDVREKDESNSIRNLGQPVEIAKKYYDAGADEICFLNITSFKNCPINDLPMLKILQLASEKLFVPLTVGGGIKDFSYNNTVIDAVDVAGIYFRNGADKVSIGSDAVVSAMNYYKNNQQLDNTSPIEKISQIYGKQAVVISVDPKRVYVTEDYNNSNNYTIIKTKQLGPNKETSCYFQCTVKGGREGVELDVIQLIKACEVMGAGELMVNSIDRDGTNSGFDLELIQLVKNNVKLPIIASSGAGNSAHFQQLFQLNPSPEAGLAAGIFHRDELPIPKLKKELIDLGLTIKP